MTILRLHLFFAVKPLDRVFALTESGHESCHNYGVAYIHDEYDVWTKFTSAR
jgi:hypothetical protein